MNLGLSKSVEVFSLAKDFSRKIEQHRSSLNINDTMPVGIEVIQCINMDKLAAMSYHGDINTYLAISSFQLFLQEHYDKIFIIK